MKKENCVAGSLSSRDQSLPFVSVIVLVLNMDETIGACLRALEELDFPKDNYEIIVVDGGSTDKTLDVVRKFGVKVLKEDRGIRGFARNYGIENAKGSIIAFLDADCIASEEWLRLLVEDHLAHPEVGAVGGGIIHSFPREGKFTNLLVADNETEYSVGSPMRYVSVIPTCNASFKKSVIEKIGLFNERLHNGEDTEICHRLTMNCYKILFDPRASILHKDVNDRWTSPDIHKLATGFIKGGRVWFEIQKAEPKQKYRLPLNAIFVLALFFPILLIRGFRLLQKMRYNMSVKTLKEAPYVAFGSFFWTLGYSKEAWRANKSAMRTKALKARAELLLLPFFLVNSRRRRQCAL